jgi:hypothetical protein
VPLMSRCTRLNMPLQLLGRVPGRNSSMLVRVPGGVCLQQLPLHGHIGWFGENFLWGLPPQQHCACHHASLRKCLSSTHLPGWGSH